MYDLEVPEELDLPEAEEPATGPREPSRADLAGAV
jgi:hypothetical protein